MAKTNLNLLPVDVQQDIKNAMHNVNTVNVYYANGLYHLGYYLKPTYPKDYRRIGIFYKSDL